MNKKHIEMILAIKEFKNMTKASDFIGVTQPTLSKFLSNTEEKFKAKLFYRRSKFMEPTEEGQIIIESLTQILQEYEKIDERLKQLRHGLQANITLATHPILGRFILPKLDSKLEKNLNTNLKYKFMNSRVATEKVISGELDLAIVADPMKYPDLVIQPLWKEYIGLYSKDGLYKNNILYNSNMIFANKTLGKIDFKEKKIIDDYGIIYSILKRSSKMGLLPNPIADSEGKLKLIKKFQPSVDVCLVYDSKKRNNKAFMELLRVIKLCSKK